MTGNNPGKTAGASDRRVAWVGALAVAALFVLLPSVRLAIVASGDAFPSPSDIPVYEGPSLMVAAILLSIGLALITVTLATARLADSSGTGNPLRLQLGTTLGIMAGFGYVLAGISARLMFSFIAANLAKTGADEGAQVAALWAVNISAGTGFLVGAVGIAGWLLLLGTTDQGHVAARPVLLTCGLLALVVALAEFGIVLLPAQLLFILVFGVLAVGVARANPPGRNMPPGGQA